VVGDRVQFLPRPDEFELIVKQVVNRSGREKVAAQICRVALLRVPDCAAGVRAMMQRLLDCSRHKAEAASAAEDNYRVLQKTNEDCKVRGPPATVVYSPLRVAFVHLCHLRASRVVCRSVGVGMGGGEHGRRRSSSTPRWRR
jgi:hypothetical protein